MHCSHSTPSDSKLICPLRKNRCERGKLYFGGKAETAATERERERGRIGARSTDLSRFKGYELEGNRRIGSPPI